MGAEEDLLITCVKWALRGVQGMGYLPLYISKSQLRFKWFNCICLLPIISSLFLVSGFIYYNTVGRSDVPQAFDWSEIMVLSISGALYSLATAVIKLTNFIGWKRNLDFWKMNVRLITEFVKAGVPLHTLGEYKELFVKVKNSIRNSISQIVVLTLVMGLVALFSGLFRLLNGHHLLKYNYTPKPINFAVNTIWFFYLMFHTFHAVWISFFIRLYATCFVILRKEVLRIMADEQDEKIYSIQNEESQTSKLRTCIGLFYKVEEQVVHFNESFGFILVFECFFSIVQIILFTFFGISWAYYNGVQISHLTLVTPIILFAHTLYLLGSNSNDMTLESKKAMIALEKNIKGVQNDELRGTIQFLGMRVYRKPPEITANNYFTLSCQLLTSIFSAVTTYLVILLQFRGSQKQNDTDNSVINPTESVTTEHYGRMMSNGLRP